MGILTPEVRARLMAGEMSYGPAVGSNDSGAWGEPAHNGHGNGHSDAPACSNCGWLMIRSGTCYRCENCGSTSGCS